MTHRYPLQPLLDAGASARVLGVSGQAWSTFRDTGMDEYQAEKYAAKMNLFAYDLWPEMLDHRIADASRACDECGESFVPSKKVQRFCCYRCKDRQLKREGARRRYNNDPAYREKQLARVARYYAECGDYKRAQERARHRRGKAVA